MEAFLQYCKSKLPSLHEFKRVRIVLGNEACDLDSAVSTLVTAFMLYSLKVNESELILPVLNLSRKELRLHTEVTFFLEECAISLDLVPCRDEIDLNALHSQGKLVLTLVDQNVLPAQDAHLQACVTCVIDHHKPELKASDNCDITIEPVGSCCTLVGELLLKKSPHLLKEPQIALLLYGTILLDTVCLSESAKKTTPSDERIIKKLEELLPDVTREEVFSALQKAKTDISGLSFEDLLIKDLKVISEGSIKIAISSLPCLTEDALKYPKSEASLKNFAFANRYEVVLLLGISVSKKTNAVQRQLAVFSSNPELRRKVVEVLSSSKADLQLSKLDVPHVQSVEVFQQGNVTASRKVILPLLRQFLQQSTTPGEVMSIKVEAVDPSLSSNGHRASSMATHIEVVDTMNNATMNDEKPALPAISAMNGSSDSMMFFGVGPGEPLSSQGSSAQNSCPYTPQNSVMEEANEVDAAHQEQLLPSFNSRDMIEKIEEKRGRLRGYEKGSSLNSSIPFTPKNSFVESSFDQYEAPQTLDMNSLSSDEFIEKVNRKKASLSGINEQLPIGAEGFAAGAEDNARNSSGKEDTVKSRSGSEKEKKVENHVSHPLEENWSDDKLLDPVDVDLDMASSYQAETVDFPESPQHLKLMRQKTREAQGLKSEDDDDVKKNSQSEDLSLIEDGQSNKKERPGAFNTEKRKKVISVNPDILSSDAREDDQKSLSSLSNKSDGDVASQVEDIVTPDDIITPEDLDDSLFERMGSSELIPEFSAAEEYEEERSWKTCVVGGEERKIDMKVIEPYKKVLSHGGYFGPNRHAIIVFSACYLPDRSRRDYDYVMDNLFLYVLTTLDQLVAEDYVLVYLHGATQRSNMPSFGWLKRCYQMIDRRLRKNLKGLYLVHPTFWLKTIVIMTKPFISSKFSRKLRFVSSLQELSDLIPMDHVCIPDKVKQFDEERLLNEA